MGEDPLLNAVQAAVDAAPADLPLRMQLARLLDERGYRTEAVRHAAAVLQQDPSHPDALALIQGTAWPSGAVQSKSSGETSARLSGDEDLQRLDDDLSDVLPPMFVDGPEEEASEVDAYDVERPVLRLADVGGMAEVKARLETAFLAPMRNPRLREMYGATLSGGLLLYGPPGCGKTFLARAVAGELGAQFLNVGLADVLDMWVGSSERNLKEIFAIARRTAPCVVFLDEVDALGQKRSQLRHTPARNVVNQLLMEMDGVKGSTDGVFVLGATNQPWDVDVALRRPGRFDRTLLVLPPDQAAREAIVRYHLQRRPIESIDVRKIAKLTDGYTGADLAHICETAAERALLESAQSGDVRMINMQDLEHAIRDVQPSIGPWLETARNVAQFANASGEYDDLLKYLRNRRLA